jgi:hypothetical protein
MSGKGRHNPMGHIESGHLNQIHVSPLLMRMSSLNRFSAPNRSSTSSMRFRAPGTMTIRMPDL